MRVHTNAFKDEIGQSGRQISSKLYHYFNYNLITEDSDTLITEDNIELISEQINPNEKELIDEELVYSISIVKNGQLLQSLMKELDIELKYELRVGDVVNAQFGVLVNNDFEYLDYGNYIVYSKEYIAENQTWRYVCYDKMLYSMVQYKPLEVAYPIAITEYIEAIANRIGLEFANSYSRTQDEFPNFDQLVLKELFEGQNITYRDILDKLSEITASNIFINDNDELELGYPKETNDTIDESYLKDVNVNFGEVFGPINKVAITETDGGYEYPAEDSQSIEENGLWQVNINDNLFTFNGDSNTIAQNILNKLNGLYYSINDFLTTGVCYYDYLDLFNVSIENNIYKCLLLNNEINITQGLEENIFTERKENTKTEQNNYETSIINNKQVQFQINKQKGEISSKVEKNGVISAINQSAEEIQINANKIKLEGYTTINGGFSIDEKGNASLHIANSGYSSPTLTIGDVNRGQDWLYNGGAAFSNNNWLTSIGVDGFGFAKYYGGPEGMIASFYELYVDNDICYQKFKGLDSEINLTYEGETTIIKPSGIETPYLTQTSKEESKKNFEKLISGLNIIKNTEIYKYHLKNQEENEKKHIGFVIGDNFKYSKEITSNENNGVDLYSMISVCFKAIQEQQEQIETLQKQVQDLERKIK